MRRLAAVSVVLIALGICGCGGSTRTRTLSAGTSIGERIETLCGDLRARLDAISRETTTGPEGAGEGPPSYWVQHFERGASESAAELASAVGEARALPVERSEHGRIEEVIYSLEGAETRFRELGQEAAVSYPRQAFPLSKNPLLQSYYRLKGSVVRRCFATMP